MIYDNLRTERTADALGLFALMEDLYSSIYPFSVYDNIVPGIKKEVGRSKVTDRKCEIIAHGGIE